MSLIPPQQLSGHHVNPTAVILSSAGGERIATHGEVTLPVTLPKLRREFRWTFVIADVSSALLGNDFLSHYAILVDCAAGSLIDTVSIERLKPAIFPMSPAAESRADDGAGCSTYRSSAPASPSPGTADKIENTSATEASRDIASPSVTSASPSVTSASPSDAFVSQERCRPRVRFAPETHIVYCHV